MYEREKEEGKREMLFLSHLFFSPALCRLTSLCFHLVAALHTAWQHFDVAVSFCSSEMFCLVLNQSVADCNCAHDSREMMMTMTMIWLGNPTVWLSRWGQVICCRVLRADWLSWWPSQTTLCCPPKCPWVSTSWTWMSLLLNWPSPPTSSSARPPELDK